MRQSFVRSAVVCVRQGSSRRTIVQPKSSVNPDTLGAADTIAIEEYPGFFTFRKSYASKTIYETQGFSPANRHRRVRIADHQNIFRCGDQNGRGTNAAQWPEVVCARGDDRGGTATRHRLGPAHCGGVGAALSETNRGIGQERAALESRDRIESRRVGQRGSARQRTPRQRAAWAAA